MNKADYKKARERKIESIDDLDSDVARRIVRYLRDNNTVSKAAARFDVPVDVVRDIARHIGR